MMHSLPETFPGVRFCKVMQASVDAILAPMGIHRPVVSKGDRFHNVDAWTGDYFSRLLCEFLSKSPTALPDRDALRKILDQTNSLKEPNPRITVARMPDNPSPQMVLAIIGGGYHEAWHTKYSKRTPVTVSEAHAVLEEARRVLEVGGVFDAKLRGLTLTLHHLIEDIRIERRGNEDFPGALQPMCDLQDFILSLEAASRTKHGTGVSQNARSVLLCCFRDLGLDYDTPLARETLEEYKKLAPQVLSLLAPGGLLVPLLREAQELSRDDGLGSLRVALRIVAALCQASKTQAPANPLTCCSCGASAQNLTLRPLKNAEGARVHGKAEATCRVCGATSEVELPDSSLDLHQEETPETEEPETEDLNAEDVGAGFDGFGDDAQEHAREQRLDAKQIVVMGPGLLSLLGIAVEVLEGGPNDGLLNHASALEVLVNVLAQQEARELAQGEMVWAPLCPSKDTVSVVASTQKAEDAERATSMLREISREVSFMRAHFRSMFRAQEMGEKTHGVRRGRRLSERNLVDSRITLRSGVLPSRAFVEESPNLDTSIALALCLDQSGSMRSMVRDIQRVCLLLIDPIDKVGGATFAFGFRTNHELAEAEDEDQDESEAVTNLSKNHRTTPVIYDVFKRWDERLDGVKWRFVKSRSEGGTPMADGVQYGLTALNERSEGHRILIVLTDGHPDYPHERVIRRQLRLAKEAGIHVIGVGVGGDAKYVANLFPDSAWAQEIREMPPVLLAKLHEVCDFSGRRRGRRAKLDGQVVRAVK
jgi:hypothetical protein